MAFEPDMDPPSFETERLRFRPLTLTDRESLLELDADPEVGRYVRLDGPPNAADLDAVLPRMLERFGEPAVEPKFWAVERRNDGTFLGWFHLRPLADPTVLDLGYRLRRDAWGMGYATEGAAAFVERAFTRHNSRRVEASALQANSRSIRVMEKLGLRLVERFLHNDRPAVR